MPRDLLVDADALSKFNDRHDFSLTEGAMHIVRVRLEEAGLGSWDVDRFAAAHNAKAPRFDSLFATEGAEAVDASSQSWSEGISFVLHNFNQLGRVLDHVERDDAEALIFMPEWTRRPFWRRIESGAWRHRVALDFYLEPGSIEANPENAEHCFIGSDMFNSRIRVMRTKKLGGVVNVIAGTDGSVILDVAPATLPSGEPPPGAKRNRAPQLGRHKRRKLARERLSEAAPDSPAP